MAKIKTLTIPNAGVEDPATEIFTHCRPDIKWYNLSREQSGSFLKRYILPYDPAILLLSIYTIEMNTYSFTQMLTAVSFGKQQRTGNSLNVPKQVNGLIY